MRKFFIFILLLVGCLPVKPDAVKNEKLLMNLWVLVVAAEMEAGKYRIPPPDIGYTDFWGNKVRASLGYANDKNYARLWSAGPDGKFGTEDDIVVEQEVNLPK